MALDSNDTTVTIASSLPLVAEEEILCRLPVKKLLQLRCVCKSWKSLISDDPKFAKKHLRMSKILNHRHLIMNVFSDRNRVLWDSPLSSVFNNVPNPTITQTQLDIPISITTHIARIHACDGILCFTPLGGRSAVLCNPSLRKCTTLPSLENHRKREVKSSFFSFGYDNFNDVYKVIAFSCLTGKYNVVDVYTLGTNYWRSIQDFPCYSPSMCGVFLGGTVNWLAYDKDLKRSCSPVNVIVSLDLEKESYQKISLPVSVKDHWDWALGMFRDCLCILTGRYGMFLEVWIMKEHGIKESWTKLYNVPGLLVDQYTMLKIVYISDEDQVLFSFRDSTNMKMKLVVYNSKIGNVKHPMIEHNDGWMDPEVYVESLISLPTI